MSKRKAPDLLSTSNKKKVRQYSVEYIKFSFITDTRDATKPHGLLYCKSFCNDSLRPIKLQEHLNKMHPKNREKLLEHFKRLKDKTSKTQEKSLDSMFKANSSMQERGLQVSYELSFLLSKNARPHTDGEDVLKPALEIYLRMMQNKPAVQELSAVPLSNDTVRRHIDDIADDLEVQLVTILRTTKFSLTLDESTVRDSEARFYSPTPDFSTTTNLLRRWCFVNLSKPPQLRWTFRGAQSIPESLLIFSKGERETTSFKLSLLAG